MVFAIILTQASLVLSGYFGMVWCATFLLAGFVLCPRWSARLATNPGERRAYLVYFLLLAITIAIAPVLLVWWFRELLP